MTDEQFHEISPSEFFYRNLQLVGFTSPSKSLYIVVKELVENSLDACELHLIKPSILISLKQVEKAGDTTFIYRLLVKDNGSGIPKRHVLNALGKVFYGSKFVLRQSRGTFGLGGTLSLLYAQLTSNRPINVVTSTGDREILKYTFYIDVTNNQPRLISFERYKNRNGWRGTILDVHLEGNYSRARRYILEYLERIAMITPYAEITFVEPSGEILRFHRLFDAPFKPPRKILPHPYGIDIETLRRLISNAKECTLVDFMCKSFHRVGEKIAKRFLKFANLQPNVKVKQLSDEDVEKLYKALKSYDGFLPPNPDVLSPIGAEVLKDGIAKKYNPEYIDVLMRPPSSYSGHPFIVEGGVAYGGGLPGEGGKIALLRYANKVPLIFDEGADVVTKVLNSIDMSIYRLPADKPVVLITHIASTKVPYKTLGKEAVADVPEVEREFELLIRRLLRRLTKHVKRVEKRIAKIKRLKFFEKHLSLISEFSSRIVDRQKPDISRLLEKIKAKYYLA